MAAFPFGRTAGSGMGSSTLDAPPPSPVNPTYADLQNPGMSPATSMGAPARQLPPEVLAGVLKSIESVNGILDDIAQMVPDIAPEIAGGKDLILRGAAKLVTAGGSPSSLSTPGRNFPGAAPFPPQNGNPT